ncbi:unnamed protein product [Chironomus riparius]|uniref:Gustatory receptor n=1 Tax=Chironomus riparius TaxID=315576 RepID=A0A9N9S8F8_9DIPT|nr:unnamed protein product [Chironomus riparius]
MQKINEKLSFLVNLFKFFGLNLENFKEPKSKYLKYLKYWPFGICFVYTCIVIAATTKMIKEFFCDGDYNIRSDYAGIIMILSLHSRGIVDLLFTLNQRRTERKFWNLVDQLDDMLEKILDIKINYRKENRSHLQRVLLILLLNCCVGVFVSTINYKSTDKFNGSYGSASYLVLTNQLNNNKFIFYVAIICNRLKLLPQHLHIIRLRIHKLKALPHIYSIIWNLSRIIEKRFAIPLIFMRLHIYMLVMFYGFILAQDTALGYFNTVHIVSIVAPQIIMWWLCYYCKRAYTIEKMFISALNRESHHKNDTNPFCEDIMLQIYHQTVIFSPKRMFEFDYNLIVNAAIFSVYFTFIFIQFYFYS